MLRDPRRWVVETTSLGFPAMITSRHWTERGALRRKTWLDARDRGGTVLHTVRHVARPIPGLRPGAAARHRAPGRPA